MTATTGPLTLSQHTATANVQHDTVASQIHKETQICCNWQDLRFCRTCHYRSAAVACGCLTFSPMTDARNPSCAVRPTNTSFFLLKPKLVMPRNFFGSETLILGFWLGPFCLFFTSFWLDSLKVGLPGRAACSLSHVSDANIHIHHTTCPRILPSAAAEAIATPPRHHQCGFAIAACCRGCSMQDGWVSQ